MHFRRSRTHPFLLLVVVAVVTLGTCRSSLAQFTLESFSPGNGSTNVSTVAAITFSFSEPVDTSIEYEMSGGFYLGATMYPNPGQPLQVMLTNEDRTVTVHLMLRADTQYWVVLRSARSTGGTQLDRPYAFTFTTGSSLSSSSISGTLTFPDGNIQGTVVELFPPLFDMGDGGSSEDEDLGPFGFAVITGSSGNFVMEHVQPGSYFLIAEKDVDGDGEPTANMPGEGIGAFDGNADLVPDEIHVLPGQQLSGMDFAVQQFLSTRARDNFADIEALALNQDANAELISVQGAPVSADGGADAWIYLFYSVVTEDTLAYGSVGTLLAPTTIPNPVDFPFQSMVPLPVNWIDSDAALAAVEAAGGLEFRTTYSEAEAVAMLFQADQGNLLPMKAAIPTAMRRKSDALYIDEFVRSLGAMDDELPIWLVAYFSTDGFNFLFAAVDAVTGEIVKMFGAPTLALSNSTVSRDAALAWQPDAVLVSVNNFADGNSVDMNGKSRFWSFVYHSPGSQSLLRVMTSSGSVFATEPIDVFDVPSLVPLPPAWIDSDIAVAQADAASNAYRTRFPNSFVSAILSRGLRDGYPGQAVWRLTYFDPFVDPVGETYMVNAQSGSVITGIQAESEIVKSALLYQNFPNPFRQETTIAFEVSGSAPVELVVYNVLGQSIRTLYVVSASEAGIHRITWDGTDDVGQRLAAGVYFYRLSVGSRQQTRSMIVAR